MTTTATPSARRTKPWQDATLQAVYALESARQQFDHAAVYDQAARSAGRITETAAEAKRELAEAVRQLHGYDPAAVPGELRQLVADAQAVVMPRPVVVRAKQAAHPAAVAELKVEVRKVWGDLTAAMQIAELERRVGMVAVARENLVERVRQLHQLAPDEVPAELKELVQDPAARVPQQK